MTQPQPPAIDSIFENILGFMLPFFLSSAGGDVDVARAAIRGLADAYNATTATEMELVGRILGFSIVSMDNLRLSMNRDMSDTKVLRYRLNAVALSRAGDQCRKILEAIQENRKPGQKPIAIPTPSIADAPPPVVQAKGNQAAPQVTKNGQRPQPAVPRAIAAPSQTGGVFRFPESTEAMKQDARMLLAVFARNGGASAPATASFPHIPDPATVVGAAVRQAFAASKRNAAAA